MADHHLCMLHCIIAQVKPPTSQTLAACSSINPQYDVLGEADQSRTLKSIDDVAQKFVSIFLPTPAHIPCYHYDNTSHNCHQSAKHPVYSDSQCVTLFVFNYAFNRAS